MALAGSRRRCAGPWVRARTTWGTSNPTNEMIPVRRRWTPNAQRDDEHDGRRNAQNRDPAVARPRLREEEEIERPGQASQATAQKTAGTATAITTGHGPRPGYQVPEVIERSCPSSANR